MFTDPVIAAIALPGSLLLGLIVGSFLNVLIFRLPKKMDQEFRAYCDNPEDPDIAVDRWFGLTYLMTPASTCPKCGHAIRAWENIPVISWLLLRARCSNCHAPISTRYPLVELSTGLLTLWAIWHFGFTPQGIAVAFLLWGLITLAMIDTDTQLLPDVLTMPLLWLGLLLNIEGHFASLTDAVIGASAGYLSLWLVFQLYRLIRGVEGMGHGDFKLLAVFGAWLGWQYLPQIILMSALVGAVIGITIMLIQRKDAQLKIPFGPYIAVAGVIALFWGKQINLAYLQIAGLA